jgi:hypothetical protein
VVDAQLARPPVALRTFTSQVLSKVIGDDPGL